MEDKKIQAEIIKNSFLAVLHIDQMSKQICFIYPRMSSELNSNEDVDEYTRFVTKFLHPDDMDVFQQAFSKEFIAQYHQRKQKDVYIQFRCRKREDDKTYHWVEAHGILCLNYTIVTIRDIENQKDIETRQRRMEYYRLIALGNTFSQLYEVDLVNSHFTSILERVQEHSQMLTHMQILKQEMPYIHEEDREEWKRHFDMSYLMKIFHQGKHLVSYEYRKLVKDKVCWMNATFLYAKRYENEEKAILMIYDITAQRQSQELFVQKKMLEKQIQTQIHHYKQQERMTQDVRNFRHDMKNHLLVLESLHDEQKTDEFKAYIETMRGYLKAREGNIRTGNSILDALINEKIAYAQKEGISVHPDIQIQESVKMEAVDVCVLFGNAFDNAIEACIRLQHKKPRISFTLIAKHHVLIFKLVNTCDISMKTRKMPFETSKDDTYLHGLGMQHMKQVVESYNGLLDIYVEAEEVHLEATLYHKNDTNEK